MSTADATFDLIGAGFGPANLALAVALQEHAEQTGGPGLRGLFLESQPEFHWHPGMLLESSRLQVSFLKDVVTMRNPRSRFTFLNYLAEQGRLDRFINLRDFYPSRIEFNDYLRWIAGQLHSVVRYRRKVVSVRPVEAGPAGGVSALRVVARDLATGQTEEYVGRNLVVATGGVPHFPEAVEGFRHRRVFHSSAFLGRVHQEFPPADTPFRFVVVGAGQSAAEVVHYLLDHYPRADVIGVIRGFGYRPMDESHFINELFSPQTVDTFYQLPPRFRAALLADARYTNYAAVDQDLIKELYKRAYQEQFLGRRVFKVLPFHELMRLEETGGRLLLSFRDLTAEGETLLDADGVILATGYHFPKPARLLAPLAAYLVPGPGGGIQVGRDYRVATGSGFAPAIYLQGCCEDTHGISDTLLSILATRSGQILQSLLEARRGPHDSAPTPARPGRTGTAPACPDGHPALAAVDGGASQ
jgi:L-ornithine N5-monooxygenase